MNTGVSKLSDQLPSLNLRTEVGFCGAPIRGVAGSWNTAGVVHPVPGDIEDTVFSIWV